MNIKEYRNNDVESASPHTLIKLVYSEIEKNIMLSILCLEDKDYEGEAIAKAKVVAGLVILIEALDLEKGGEVAQNLQSLYKYSFSVIQNNPKKEDFEGILSIFKDLSEAWVGIEKEGLVC